MINAAYLRLAMLLFVVAALRGSAQAGFDERINWPGFLARHDLIFKRPPSRWGEGAFMGNGLLGANMYLTDDQSALRFHIGRTDVYVRNEYRVPIGDLVLHTAGKITGGEFRLDLWNAEVRGVLKTDRGEIAIRAFTHAHEPVQVVETDPSEGERECRWEFAPARCVNPRTVYRREPVAPEDMHPEPEFSGGSVLQRHHDGGEHATVWRDVREGDRRIHFLSVGFAPNGIGALAQASEAVGRAVKAGMVALVQSHRQWWHDYYPASFLSLSDTRIESFYWIQIYKLACATRADRPAMDLMGPWFYRTPWPAIWWNLNIQLAYSPVYPSNHLDLGESLCRLIDRNVGNLADNTGPFAHNSEAIGGRSGHDCHAPLAEPKGILVEGSLGNYAWALHNYYMQYSYSMDDAMLRDRLLPRMKRAMNFYLHHLKEKDDGRLHVIGGNSPEYHQEGGHDDCNYDLALIRWLCQALIDSCARLGVNDPMIPTWRNTLERLTPYPVDGNGLMVSADTPFAETHRHYSHLLMIYPLYLMNWDQHEHRELMTRSVDHWTSMPRLFKGFSWTGAASMYASMERPADAMENLDKIVNRATRWMQPNTLYLEAGPVIESPLSAARSLQDMLLQSWGGTIRVFPAVPDAWPDVTIHRMRAEGAFLVSAARRGGTTQWIRIESLAGELCRLKCDMETLDSDAGQKVKRTKDGLFEINLNRGEAIVLYRAGGSPDAIVEPVAPQRASLNPFGVR